MRRDHATPTALYMTASSPTNRFLLMTSLSPFREVAINLSMYLPRGTPSNLTRPSVPATSEANARYYTSLSFSDHASLVPGPRPFISPLPSGKRLRDEAKSTLLQSFSWCPLSRQLTLYCPGSLFTVKSAITVPPHSRGLLFIRVSFSGISEVAIVIT